MERAPPFAGPLYRAGRDPVTMRVGMALHGEGKPMRSVSRTLLGHGWHKPALLATGLGLGVVGGFVGGLLREREALNARRAAATTHPVNDALATRRVAARRLTPVESADRPLEMRA